MKNILYITTVILLTSCGSSETFDLTDIEECINGNEEVCKELPSPEPVPEQQEEEPEVLEPHSGPGHDPGPFVQIDAPIERNWATFADLDDINSIRISGLTWPLESSDWATKTYMKYWVYPGWNGGRSIYKRFIFSQRNGILTVIYKESTYFYTSGTWTHSEGQYAKIEINDNILTVIGTFNYHDTEFIL